MTTFIIILIVILVILYVHHKAYLDPFVNLQSTNEPTTLLIFVSKSCGHCVNYNQKHHDSVVELAKKKGVEVKRIFSDEDPDNLFDKFKVMYVPTCYVMKGDKIHKNLGSNVNPQSIQTALA
jgi:thiol-disulfide isomerase/thioredoxin